MAPKPGNLNMWLTKLRIEHLGGKWIRLLEPLACLYGGKVYIVPAGFVCDGASVPRLPFAYWLTGNTAHRSAVLHDMLYRWHFLPRPEADLMFRGTMSEPEWRKRMMFWAVRLFGFTSYKSRPGQLDPRKENEGNNYYGGWKTCVMSHADYLDLSC